MQCPCCSDKPFADCCEPVIQGKRKAATASELMRSRYSAYATGAIDWVVESQIPEGREYTDRKATEEWSRRSEWKGLEVLEITHHEVASFRNVDGTWYFVDGVEVKPRPFKRVERKVGLNEPCPCGSGKKFKKCCGRPGAAAS